MSDDKSISLPTDEGKRSILAQIYNDHGNWARHYSTVRMTIGTFFLTAATGIITLRWDKPELKTSLCAAFIMLIGAALFLWFTKLTKDKMDGQNAIAAVYRKELNTAWSGPQPVSAWPWYVACAVLVISFGVFDWSWWNGRPASGKGFEINVPITVQAGENPAASFQVPVKVTVP